MLCPTCGEVVKYTLLINLDPPSPFFYCDSDNNVLVRKSDDERVPVGDPADPQHFAKLLALWESIVKDAPPCPCGGRFGLWTNVKCPHCGIEFPYNRGVKDPFGRIMDRKVVVIDGAVVVGDGPDDSWVARVEVN